MQHDSICLQNHGRLAKSATGLDTWYPAKVMCMDCLYPFIEAVINAYQTFADYEYGDIDVEKDKTVIALRKAME